MKNTYNYIFLLLVSSLLKFNCGTLTQNCIRINSTIWKDGQLLASIKPRDIEKKHPLSRVHVHTKSLNHRSCENNSTF